MLGKILLTIAAVVGSAFSSDAAGAGILNVLPAKSVSKLVTDVLLLGCKFNRSVDECVWTTPRMHFLLANASSLNTVSTYDSVGNTLWLNISNLSVDDSGDYECQIPRTSAREKIVVAVHKPPDAVSIVGGTAIAAIKDVDNSIICSVTNVKPEAKIEWIGTPAGTVVTTSQASTSNALLFNTVSNLTIKPTDINRINYTCKVTNNEFLGSESPVATQALEASTSVDILHAPIISSMQHVPSPAKPKYREHDSLTMTCIVSSSNPPTVTWRWFSGGVLLPGETTSSYVISALPASLNGQQVICEAANSIGATNFTYPFIVEYGPRLKKPLLDIEVDLGDQQHSFLCDIDSNPTANLYWRKMANHDVVKTDKTLQFTNIKDTDIGGYTCVASVDGFQEVVTANAYLLLKGPPMITGNEEYFASQGEDAEISCDAESIPKESTEFVWTKGRNAIPVDFSKTDKYQQKVLTGTHGKSSKLTIKGITTDDFVVYNCTVTNARGSYFKAFRLQQRDDFPWQYAVIGVGSGIGLIVVITIIVCLVKRRKSKSFRKNSASASMDSPVVDNSASKPYYMSNYGAGYAAPNIWMSNQYGDPTNLESYPLNMDVGYENMGSGDNMPQPESSFQPSPTRFEPFYSTFPRGQTHYAVTTNDGVDNTPVQDQGFYSAYATGQRPMRQFSDTLYNPVPATGRGTFDYQGGYSAGQQIYMDRPAVAETSHLATNV